MTDMLTIEIDGRACEAAPGEMIIAVADREGISIPRFCYHKKLSIAANCRMCLVEAEQGGRPFPKPVPACATPVGPGMKVLTRSPKAIEAQQGTMEFLLINHPLDCPICDQGGECELQDVAMGYGGDQSRYTEGKRVVMDEDLGPLIATEMTRCIHCTRCVRFGAEIAGLRELGATGRGEDVRIGTFVAHTLAHELSGNIIDLCPVGALTSKPYRFTARAWELTDASAIAPHDGVGSNLRLHLRRGQVMRVHPHDNEAVNESWIADRDRFSYVGLNGADRLTEPLIKRDGAWVAVEWTEALALVAQRLKAADPATTGWLIAPNATLEEMYLAQGLARALGCANIDHRLRQRDFRGDAADPRLPWLGLPIAELPAQRSVLLIGTDIRQEQPLLAHRLRQAVLAGGSLALVNPYRLDLTHPADQLAGGPAGMLDNLAAIANALGDGGLGALKGIIARAAPSAEHQAVADSLKSAGANGAGLILLGALAAAHPDYSLLKALAYRIAAAAGCKVGYLPAAANSVGAYLAGALPQVQPGGRPADPVGLPVAEILAAPHRTLVLWGLEPAYDLGNPAQAVESLAQADFVVAASAFRCPSLESVAQVLLPIGAFAETSGTFVNGSGTWQSFQGAVAPPGAARPGWKVLRVLGNLLNLKGFEYLDTAAIRTELAALCGDARPDNGPAADFDAAPAGLGEGLIRIGNVPTYALDALVRRSPPLQRTPTMGTFGAYLNAAQAADLGLAADAAVVVSQQGAAVHTRVLIDDRVPPGCVRIPAGVPGSESLGDQIAPVSIRREE
ncbi:NADH-quinone oxidoreductase subunit NuoG [Candidatus Thiodictyon syntrophicum]|jgi:NADH-quinone oxidoreductase subunit G|uniref:NADH-quinone oxidoreductase n=1 Tax=Candidatus Thiodictyon syntrophicum TaxID=1166950 RepID=A0A2K8UDW8_9GAMM|nr:NADH-quinone oxidoreductase subunit NuoG [Candidatus Thiodictyon syntrophicum]AUB83793.1 NADH-quinone oxidoreductase subunit G [Candidatus Thiodictyon syntrophicum]